MYHDPDGSDDSDDDDGPGNLYALDTKDSPDPHRKIIEVETSPDAGPHVADDFDSMAEEYGDGIWVVETYDDAITLVRALIEEGRLSDDIDTNVRSFEKLNEQLDADGMSKVLGMKNLMDNI